MKNKLVITFVLTFQIFASSLTAQDTIFMHTQFDRESLKVRWSFLNLDMMAIAFDVGWQLSIYEEGKSSPVREISMQARPESEFQSVVSSESDSVTFEIYRDLQNDIFEVESPEQKAWLELGFYFGLLDNFELAKKLGLGFETSELDESKVYQIRISLQKTPSQQYIPTMQTIVFQDPVLRPKPETPLLECNENIITITALPVGSAASYSSFGLEKANANQPLFSPLNERPLIVNYTYGAPVTMLKDTINDLGLTHYRLVGKDYWGDYGPYSDTISVEPCDILFLPPYPVLAKERRDSGAMHINWMIPDTLQPFIKGFNIYRASAKFGKYQKINIGLLQPDAVEFIDQVPINDAYYQVGAVYENDLEKRSMSVHAALLDISPPGIPTNLQAHLDTNNMIVTLKWNGVKDDDLKGYRVSFSHGPESPKFLLNNLEIENPMIRDTLDMKQLHRRIYYWVTSRDFNQNESFYSDSTIIVIPHKIPPASPRLTHIISGEHFVDIYYDRSASGSNIDHVLQKRKRTDENWMSIPLTPQDWHNQFRDSSISILDTFEYRLMAIDDQGLKSFSNTVSATVLESLMLPSFEYVKAENNDSITLLYFDYQDQFSPVQFRIIGGSGPENMQTLSLLDAQDVLLRSGIIKQESSGTYSLYRYEMRKSELDAKYFRIRAISESGKVSPYSSVFSY